MKIGGSVRDSGLAIKIESDAGVDAVCIENFSVFCSIGQLATKRTSRR